MNMLDEDQFRLDPRFFISVTDFGWNSNVSKNTNVGTNISDKEIPELYSVKKTENGKEEKNDKEKTVFGLSSSEQKKTMGDIALLQSSTNMHQTKDSNEDRSNLKQGTERTFVGPNSLKQARVTGNNMLMQSEKGNQQKTESG